MQLDPRQVAQLEAAQRAEIARRRKERPADLFPWHPIQEFMMDAPSRTKGDVRIILAAGGNRGGKSKGSMGLYAQVLRRKNGINDQLRTTDPTTGRIRGKGDRDPLTVWVIPPTLEKARQDWLTPQDRMGLKHWCGDLFMKHEQTPDNVIYSRPPGFDEAEMYDDQGKLIKELCDKTIIKSQDQKLHTFESSEVDLVLFDEEVQREEVWNSCLMRIATTNGVIVMSYTPLNGLSWSYHRYWKHLVVNNQAVEVQDRCWIHDPRRGATVICCQMGSRDNPRARDYADEIEADPEMSKAEKMARLYGQYGFVEGTLVSALAGLDVANPVGKHRQYVVDRLPGISVDGKKTPGKIVRWLLVADPNKSYGAVLSAIDSDNNLFFVASHLQEGWPDRRHADAMRKMEKKWATGKVERFADPGSAGAQSIVNMADSGLYFNTISRGAGSVSRSVKKLRGLTYVDPDHRHPITQELGAPRVYFFRPGLVKPSADKSGRVTVGCELADQIGQARQTDNASAPPDTPHKDIRSKLDLFDCARYTAVLAAETFNTDDERDGRSLRTNRIPSDATMMDMGDDTGELQEVDFWIPQYDF